MRAFAPFLFIPMTAVACGDPMPAPVDEGDTSGQAGAAAAPTSLAEPAASEQPSNPTVLPPGDARASSVGLPVVQRAAECTAPAGVSASPGSVSETIALINSLPKPVTVSCFLQALERPLWAYATGSQFSAQPADSRRSPRVFLFNGALTLSVVLDGPSSQLLEFGQFVSATRSVKGEVAFPVEENLEPNAPYTRVFYGDQGTICRFCHADERAAPKTMGSDAFASAALRPRPEEDVSLGYLGQETLSCDAALEPRRCSLLQSMFLHGDVHYQDFFTEMPTFY